eukprot:g19410.t1
MVAQSIIVRESRPAQIVFIYSKKQKSALVGGKQTTTFAVLAPDVSSWSPNKTNTPCETVRVVKITSSSAWLFALRVAVLIVVYKLLTARKPHICLVGRKSPGKKAPS